jgi:integrase
MPKKKKRKRSRRLLLRKKPGPVIQRINLTKRSVAALAHPPEGRDIYRDERSDRLYLRVTPTVKTFYWEKTVKRIQKRVNIGRFPEINPEQARAKADDISADYVKGIDVQANRRSERNEATFGDLWKDYRENRPRRTDAQKEAGEYSRNLEQQWAELKKWKKKKLSEITKKAAVKKIKKIRERGPVYANRIHAHGKAMFNFAILEWEWTGKNPFDFKMPSENGRERSRNKDARVEEIPEFIESLSACSEDMHLLFLCVLRTGRRIGEVKAMRWDDLRLTKGLWFIPKTKTEPQKTWLSPEIVELLTEREKHADADEEWVFPSSSESGHIEEIKKAWEQVREATGLHNLQARDLRRTFISKAQEEGVPIAAVKEQVGHASIATTAKHYTAFSDSAQSDWLKATNASMTKAAQAK